MIGVHTVDCITLVPRLPPSENGIQTKWPAVIRLTYGAFRTGVKNPENGQMVLKL